MVEKKWDQSHLVIATLSQLFESANDVKVGINNHRQLMEAESVRVAIDIIRKRQCCIVLGHWRIGLELVSSNKFSRSYGLSTGRQASEEDAQWVQQASRIRSSCTYVCED